MGRVSNGEDGVGDDTQRRDEGGSQNWAANLKE